MSDRDLPSVDRLATAAAPTQLQARRKELLDGDDTTVDLVACAVRGISP